MAGIIVFLVFWVVTVLACYLVLSSPTRVNNSKSETISNYERLMRDGMEDWQSYDNID